MQSLLLILAALLPSATPRQDAASLDDLRAGQWITVKGEVVTATGPDERTRFLAEDLELTAPEEFESLLGTVSAAPDRSGSWLLLGQPINLSERTEWTRVEPGTPLVGRRVRIDGRYRGPGKFSARDIRPWGEGRDRLAGRIDEINAVAGGFELEVMRFTVFVPKTVVVELERPLDEIQLIPRRWKPAQLVGLVDEDDLLRERIELAPGLRIGGQLGIEGSDEDEYDLDDQVDQGRSTLEAVARLRLAWRVADDLFARAEGRFTRRWLEDEKDGPSNVSQTRLGETWLYWRNALGGGWDAQAGRQDFDDPREWIYDQNLDGLRLIHTGASTRLELAAATSWGGEASPRNRDALNLFTYFSNLDRDQHLAGWVTHRSFQDGSGDQLTHFGFRALGEWLPDSESWLELSGVAGEEAGHDVLGYAFDVGTTFEFDELPFSLSLGYALGSGDNDSGYRQTGLEDNNARLGTVTSIRYYGEVLEPELSNIAIGTVGSSWWPEERTSVSLIAHSFHQLDPATVLRGTNLDAKPDGYHNELGYEFDFVVGSRRWRDLDIELVAGIFFPGVAFPNGSEAARFARFQLRYRF
ncbi:alginate export family protein [Engelhardtia mirabilis]|uniref:Alginate production protein AlgE n=1 Tax=Engelhardtia mirabilis TaxID=2528011 RepID=A0A518BDL5_9BACT|nr:Alginate production protein AlgE precursor [Planctomycetes bacterium Pla133]QDU99404.1 Alginate production protein AlgE precursor [Planctomycetes bacterium Pla86]